MVIAMRNRVWLVGVVAAMLAVVGSRAVVAADLTLEIGGTFGPATKLNGVALGVETPFSFRAVFDPAQELFHTPGAGIFAVTDFTIAISGHGSFSGVPNANLNAVVTDPAYHVGNYTAGLVDLTATSFFLNKYSAVSLPLNPQAPTLTNFVGYLGREAGAFPYVIPLAGGAGNLDINDFGSGAPTAALVPECSALVLVAVGGCALGLARRSLVEVRAGARRQRGVCAVFDAQLWMPEGRDYDSSARRAATKSVMPMKAIGSPVMGLIAR